MRQVVAAHDAAVERVLNVDQVADRAVGQSGFDRAVAPDRHEREAVVLVGRHRLHEDVFAGHDGAVDAPRHRIGQAAGVLLGHGDRLARPGLQQHHAVAGRKQLGPHESIAAALTAGNGVTTQQTRRTGPHAHQALAAASLGNALQLGLFGREQGNRHVQIHHLGAEQETGVVAVAADGAAVVHDVAPVLGHGHHLRTLLVLADRHLQPAQAGDESLIGGKAALKAGLVCVVKPLHQLLLGLSGFARLLVVVARRHGEVDASAALCALEPVDDGLHRVVRHRRLPTGGQLGALLWRELVVLVVPNPLHPVAPVLLLAQQLFQEEIFQAQVPVVRRRSAGRHSASSVVWFPRLAVTSNVGVVPATRRRRMFGGADGMRTRSIMALSTASM